MTKVTLALSSSPMALDTPPTHHLLAHNRPGTTTSPRHNLNTTTRSNNNPLCLEILLNKQEAKLSSHFLCFVSVIFFALYCVQYYSVVFFSSLGARTLVFYVLFHQHNFFFENNFLLGKNLFYIRYFNNKKKIVKV